MDGYFLKQKGLSLLEIIIGLFVMASLLIALLPLGNQIIEKFRSKNTEDNLSVIGQACQQYYLANGHWPNSIADLQPDFLNHNFNKFTLISQTNTLTVTVGQSSTTVVKPRRFL
jgi:type II secretory pathway pseudopilin PulG